MNYYMSDFETTTNSIDETKSYVWLWGLSNIHKEERYWGINIESFFEQLNKIKKASIIYFHNLDWDGNFLLHYLGSNLKYKDTFHAFKKVGLNRGEFSMFAAGVGKYYKIWFRNENDVNISFVCSYRLFNCSVSSLMGVDDKFKIDYDIKQLPKSKEDITKEQLDYLWNDIDVPAKFIKKYLDDVGEDKSLTSGSTSLKLAKKFLKNKWYEYFVDKIEAGYINDKGNYIEGEWDKIAPAMRGGYTFIKPGIERTIRKNITDIDINSCYTYMIGWETLPVGRPIWDCKKACNHLKLYKVLISGKVKPFVVPFVTDMFGYETHANYLEKFENLITYIPDFYWDLIKKYHELTYEKVERVACFQHKKEIFKDYVVGLLKQKDNSKKGSYEYNSAKIYSHSIPGKMGSKPLRRNYFFEEYDKNNKKHNYLSSMKFGKYVFNYRLQTTKASYSPLFIWVVHLGRAKIIDAIQKVNSLCQHIHADGAFNYCDTDSIKMSICEDCYKKLTTFIDFDQKRVGAFSLDGRLNYGYYIKRKLYLQFNDLDEKLHPKHCGSAGITKSQLEELTAREAIEKFELNNKKSFDYLKEHGLLFLKKDKKKVEGGLILSNKGVKI